MENLKMTVRRLILQMQVGQARTIPHSAAHVAAIQAECTHFAKARKMSVTVTQDEAGDAIITRNADQPAGRASPYPEIGELEIGEQCTISEPPWMHQRVRMAAAAKGRAMNRRFVCNRIGDAIRVTRLPCTPDEVAAHPIPQDLAEIARPGRPPRWDLSPLEHTDSLRFDVPAADIHKIRLAASFQARSRGWKLSCRADATGVTVYRLPVAA